MSKMRIVGIVAGSVLAAGLLTGGAAGAVWLFTPPTHPTVSVSQSHEISTAKQEDTQLAAATSRDASQWTIQQEAAAKKAAEEAAAAALAAQQAAEAQAAADAAAQAQATQDTQTADVSSDGGSSSPTLCPAGTTAQAVDANGNESNCLENNPTTGQQCVAYDASNNCTAWLEP